MKRRPPARAGWRGVGGEKRDPPGADAPETRDTHFGGAGAALALMNRSAVPSTRLGAHNTI